MEKCRIWENGEYGKIENMGKLRIWENREYGKMGEIRRQEKEKIERRNGKKAKIERWEMIRWKTLDI